jgi:hypothetical protein
MANPFALLSSLLPVAAVVEIHSTPLSALLDHSSIASMNPSVVAAQVTLWMMHGRVVQM